MLLPLGQGRDDTASLLAHFKANSPGRAELGPGRFLTTGLKLEGLTCSIRGCDDATVIASLPDQTGPVLDFHGYSSPDGFRAIRTIERFAVEGDGTAGIAKGGIRLGIAPGAREGQWGLAGVVFRDISVEKTGGIPLDLAATVCSHFERITLGNPVAAAANDVPYIRGHGPCNGNRLIGIGLRSYTRDLDVAPGGAARFTSLPGNEIWCPSQNTFDSWWYEFNHMPQDACLFCLEGNYNVIRDFRFFDVGAAPGVTGTAYYRILRPPPGKEDYGGNEIRGLIDGGGDPGSPRCGVEMWQRANSVEGRKGKGGRNVVLMPQARFTSVDWKGGVQEPSLAENGVVDHQGRATVLDGTVTIFDRPSGYYFLGGGPNGATVEFGGGRKLVPQGLFLNDDQYWTEYGITPGVGVRWPGSGTLTSGPNESLRYVGWEERPLGSGNRRQGFVVPPMRGK